MATDGSDISRRPMGGRAASGRAAEELIEIFHSYLI
jgi:hypothetical protein